MDLPNERAFPASTAASFLQLARRLSRFDFEVFFLGQAIGLKFAKLTILLFYAFLLDIAQWKIIDLLPLAFAIIGFYRI
jgi:hypothetical protein